MTAPTTTAAFFLPPDPDWCTNCVTPDPGVVDHYSRIWAGGDWYDAATWKVQVTQRVQQGPDGNLIEGLAVIDVTGVEGTYASTADLARALLLAQQVADRINKSRRGA
ncbi:hypothetical protein [Verrucosispora sp. NA02020]|uniref:hypothetical protein n=1 Tax=Verrucosispora sp. NA02020 TaxID=2742132 RepID=UPI00159008E0|nr:hypothetical protein [Verrucosispora sp. NA02020]QKW15446.1 hypothetical protein HUT12_23540 [Verrucosispora sp. NA02020]